MKTTLMIIDPPFDDEQFAARGVSSAIAVGPKIGETIAHPDDPITHLLLSLDGTTAVCAHGTTGEEIRFPLVECFDPNVACRLAIESKFCSTIERLK